jgi:hypothetical protein
MQVQPPDVSYTLALLADTTCSKDRRNIRKCRWANYEQATKYFSCPYGIIGDQLWVRETWCSPERPIVGYAADSQCGAWISDGEGGKIWLAHGYLLQAPSYQEVVKNLKYAPTFGIQKYGGKWRPSIFMPRWASRIQLEVLGIRVQRLQEISEEDALAEGVYGDESPYGQATPIMCFKAGWDKINGKRGSWESNPWVWVVEFKQIKGEKL